ncbi:Protein of unknown function [Gryllus bimaculatus]|nr:Protein of unknown function [Gryllus bimaculatus]
MNLKWFAMERNVSEVMEMWQTAEDDHSEGIHIGFCVMSGYVMLDKIDGKVATEHLPRILFFSRWIGSSIVCSSCSYSLLYNRAVGTLGPGKSFCGIPQMMGN